MITKLLPLQFLKKSPFYGSQNNMRYLLDKQQDQLIVCIYPGPYGFQATPDEKKQYFTFEFSDSGYNEAIALLNQKYEEIDWDKMASPLCT